jgi:hypothetical protein
VGKLFRPPVGVAPASGLLSILVANVVKVKPPAGHEVSRPRRVLLWASGLPRDRVRRGRHFMDAILMKTAERAKGAEESSSQG